VPGTPHDALVMSAAACSMGGCTIVPPTCGTHSPPSPVRSSPRMLTAWVQGDYTLQITYTPANFFRRSRACPTLRTPPCPASFSRLTKTLMLPHSKNRGLEYRPSPHRIACELHWRFQTSRPRSGPTPTSEARAKPQIFKYRRPSITNTPPHQPDNY